MAQDNGKSNQPSRKDFLRLAASAAAAVGGAGLLGRSPRISFANSPTISMNTSGTTLPSDYLGLNGAAMFDSVDLPRCFTDPQLLNGLQGLQPATLRFPGGTEANYYDPTGGTLFQSPSRPGFLGDPLLPRVQTPDKFAALFNKGVRSSASPIILLNMLTGAGTNPTSGIVKPDIVTQLAMLDTLAANGIPINYIELGNEFYFNLADNTSQYGFDGTTYGSTSYAWYQQITQYSKGAYANAQIAVVGRPTPSMYPVGTYSDVTYASPQYTPPGGNSGSGFLGPTSWNTDVLSKWPTGQKPNYWVFHLYPARDTPLLQSSYPTPPASPTYYLSPLDPAAKGDAPSILYAAYLGVNNFLQQDVLALNGILASNPNAVFWVTEYNVGGLTINPSNGTASPSTYPILVHGRWTHALFVALQTILLTQISYVKRLICHTLIDNAVDGLLFSNTRGFVSGGPSPWLNFPSLATIAYGQTAAGLAMSVLLSAIVGATKTYTLNFQYVTTTASLRYSSPITGYPSTFTPFYGSAFDVGNTRHIILLNAGPTAVTFIGDISLSSGMTPSPATFSGTQYGSFGPSDGSAPYDPTLQITDPTSSTQVIRTPVTSFTNDGVSTIQLQPFTLTHLSAPIS